MATPVSTVWERVAVDGSDMAVYVASPEESGARPAVVIAQHAPGVDEFIQSMARRFAEVGYVSVAPDLFHREPRGDRRGYER